jgi:hypothetical protein
MKDWIKELCPEIAEQFPWQAELIAEAAQNAVKAEREACAKIAQDFAKKWWGIHCATNTHMETSRKAHEAFCEAYNAIRARGEQ